MSKLPTEAAARKAIPIHTGLVRYFPDALTAVAELSRIGNDQHNPGKPLFWDRTKSTDELDALTRHLFEAGTVDTDGVRHSTKVAWRALANLQKEIEASGVPAAEEPAAEPEKPHYVYVPQTGDRVRVVEIAPFESSPEHIVNGTYTVSHTLVGVDHCSGWLLLNRGTWCRVVSA